MCSLKEVLIRLVKAVEKGREKKKEGPTHHRVGAENNANRGRRAVHIFSGPFYKEFWE